jgi:hypothetical protein
MKLLVLIIAVILMSVFSQSIYAESQKMEMEEIDVTGVVDPELAEIEKGLEEVKFFNRTGAKKIEKFNKTQTLLSELIPKQIELAKGRRKFYKIIDAKSKYLNCINSKDEEDCEDLKDDLEKLNIRSSLIDSQHIKTQIINPQALAQVRKCSSITKEYFPDFRAVVQLDIVINSQGLVQTAYINEDESEISHDLEMFSRCIVHFARKLQFSNTTGKIASIYQNLIFGQI